MAGLYEFEAMTHDELLGTAEGMKAGIDDLREQLSTQWRDAYNARARLTTTITALVLSAGGEIQVTRETLRQAKSDEYTLVEVQPGLFNDPPVFRVLKKDEPVIT